MSFVIKQSASYVWPVAVEFPGDGGKIVRQTFDAEFKRLSQSRLKELGEQLTAGDLDDVTVAAEVLVGWPEGAIKDDEGEPIPFSDSALNELLDLPKVATAIVLAFYDSLAGAKRKN